LLAMPLTVCLVVLGRHIDALNFIEVLLGDQPALQPQERFYQRLLAGDDTEAADMAEQQLKRMSLTEFYDAVAMPALALAQTDAARGKLTQEKQVGISDTIDEVTEHLSDFEDRDVQQESHTATIPTAAEPGDLSGPFRTEVPVLCVASRSPLDQAAATMLTQLLDKNGLRARVQPFTDVQSARSFKVDAPDAPLVCVSYLGLVGNPAHVRHVIRRLRRVMPNARFLAGFWMLSGEEAKAEEWRIAVRAELVATSLSGAVESCLREAGVAPQKDSAAA
jgi:hypothetical protein